MYLFLSLQTSSLGILIVNFYLYSLTIRRSQVFVLLDNQQCNQNSSQSCFETTIEAAAYLAGLLVTNLLPSSLPIISVECK